MSRGSCQRGDVGRQGLVRNGRNCARGMRDAVGGRIHDVERVREHAGRGAPQHSVTGDGVGIDRSPVEIRPALGANA